MTWRMPPEWAPHERLWMAWPSSGYTLGDTAADADEARSTWAAVAHAAAGFEPVTMVVDPSAVDAARRHLSSQIEIVVADLDDAWMRDIGPTFVVSSGDGAPRLGAVDWVFNGWGAQEWASWSHDARIGRTVGETSGAESIPSTLVNEGGGIHVDGAGTVLATETVQLDPERNPGIERSEVDAEFARTLGTSNTVWLPRGLTRDSARFGTRGHVDLVAAFTESGAMLVHDQRDERHPDHGVSREIVTVLHGSRDATGSPFEIVSMPAPATLRDAAGFVDYSYLNHVAINGAVIACAFGDAGDARAAAILRDVYPGRTVVSVDARPLFARGGGIHCITQQQPRV